MPPVTNIEIPEFPNVYAGASGDLFADKVDLLQSAEDIIGMELSEGFKEYLGSYFYWHSQKQLSDLDTYPLTLYALINNSPDLLFLETRKINKSNIKEPVQSEMLFEIAHGNLHSIFDFESLTNAMILIRKKLGFSYTKVDIAPPVNYIKQICAACVGEIVKLGLTEEIGPLIKIAYPEYDPIPNAYIAEAIESKCGTIVLPADIDEIFKHHIDFKRSITKTVDGALALLK